MIQTPAGIWMEIDSDTYQGCVHVHVWMQDFGAGAFY